MKEKFLVSLISALALFFIAGCSSFQPLDLEAAKQKVVIRKNELAISIPDEIRTLDPIKVENLGELQIINSLYEGLVSINPDTNEIEPALAADWSVTSDGLVYTFFLREKALFHSGRAVTASDVKESWKRAIKSATADTWYVFHNISGYEEFLQGQAEDLAGVTVVNGQELQVKLDNPDKTFLYKLDHPATYVVDVEFIENLPYGYGEVGSFEQPTRVNGTGPYALVEWIESQHITLKAFEEYPVKSQFERIDFLLSPDIEKGYADLRRGYVDILRTGQKLPQILKAYNPAIEQQQKQELKGEIYYLGFNLNKGLFQDQSLRLGISLAINRSRLVDVAQKDKEAMGLLPRTVVQGRSPLSQYEYSLNSAQRLIDYAIEGVSRENELTVFYVKDEYSQTLLEEIANNLKQAGLEVQTKELASRQELVNGLKAGNILFFLDKWSAQTEEAGFFLAPFFYSASPFNLIGYSNELVDELIEQCQQQQPFSREYLETVLQIERIIMSDVPVVTILEGTDYILANDLIEDPAFDPIKGIRPQKIRVKSELTFNL